MVLPALAAAVPAVVGGAKAAGTWLASNPQVVGSIFNSLGSVFGSSAKSSEPDMGSLYNQLLVNQKITQQNMDYQYNLNQESQRNSYQNMVYSLRQAGLNPILATGSSPSVPSVSQGAGSDLSALISSNANSSQAKIAKDQLKLNLMNTFADVAMKMTSSANMAEKTKTEKFIQELNKSEAELNFVRKTQEEIKNLYLPRKEEATIKNLLDTAEATLIQAKVAQLVAPSIIANNYSNSAARQKEGEAAYISATSGNTEKFVLDLVRGLLNSPEFKGSFGEPDIQYLEKMFGRDVVKSKHPEWYK